LKEDEMEAPCGTHGRKQKCIKGFGRRIRRKEAVGRPTYTYDDKIKLWENVDWIYLSQNRDQWRVLLTQ
jgi:hypothetical protein